MVVKATIDQCTERKAKRADPKDPTKVIEIAVKTAILGGCTVKRGGQEIPISALGAVIFDPEKPELQKFAVVGSEVLELMLEQRPNSDRSKMLTFVTRAVLDDVPM
jgi:hypothetical protein